MIEFGYPPRKAGGLIGTWVKIPSLETVELLGHAGFDFVVIDLEHAPLSMETAFRLLFAAQAVGLAALVRLSERSGAQIQRLLDAGADGLLVPYVSSIEMAETITRAMVFAPKGTRGLGATSRAGRWGLMPIADYVARGDVCLRMVQLESWEVLRDAQAYLDVETVNGVFVGLGDLFLSSGRRPDDVETRTLVKQVADAANRSRKICGIAASSVEEARCYFDYGYSLVMVSNDATLFGRAAQTTVAALRG